MFVAGGAWTSDPTPAIDCTDCLNLPASGEFSWTTGTNYGVTNNATSTLISFIWCSMA